MAEHQGFMLLYTETWGRGLTGSFQFLAPPEDLPKLLERAREFVGTHTDVDGCSTQVVESLHGNVHMVRRSTSFGPREATITTLPILRE